MDIKDSEIIAEVVHRFGGEYVVKACQEYIKKSDRKMADIRGAE